MSANCDPGSGGCGRGFASVNALANHLFQSDEHGDEYNDWDDALAAARSMTDADDDAGGVEQADAGADPTLGDADGSATRGPECPECGGGNIFDARPYTDYRYGCSDCSDGDTWVVFNE